jgi:uncharacterized membrane protein (UPF0127 family)
MFLGLRVAAADTLIMRLKGLPGRVRLKPDDGIRLTPSHGIDTIGMFFAIDVIYLDTANRVIHLIENMGPFRISPIRIQCAGILELVSRTICLSNTQIGEELLGCTAEQLKAYCGDHRPDEPIFRIVGVGVE